MFLTFRYETDNKQILKLCPITVGFQLTQIFKWNITLTSVMNMEKFCCLYNRSFNSGNIHRWSVNSFTWYWLKYRNTEANYWKVMTTKDLRVPYRDITALSKEIGSDFAIFRLISGFIYFNQCKIVYYIIWKL